MRACARRKTGWDLESAGAESRATSRSKSRHGEVAPADPCALRELREVSFDGIAAQQWVALRILPSSHSNTVSFCRRAPIAHRRER